MIDGHGDDCYKYTNQVVSNFSSNVYNRQDLSALQAHLCSRMDLIRSYPEPDAHSLSFVLSREYDIAPENCSITNGATEAIYLIAQTFRQSYSAILIPTFSEYEDACRIHQHKLSFFEDIARIDVWPDLIWICNPNNPTGKTYDIAYLKNVVSQHADTLFVFDQSYGCFTDKPVWDINEAINYRNVILLHSMTKQYAVPGLRLGFITAHTSLIKKIATCRMPWSVNALAIESAFFLLQHKADLPDIRSYLRETQRLQQALSDRTGVEVLPTDTHFFLSRIGKRSAAELKQYLMNKHGILIRDASNFRGLTADCVRIATQSREENDRLVKAIAEWI